MSAPNQYAFDKIEIVADFIQRWILNVHEAGANDLQMTTFHTVTTVHVRPVVINAVCSVYSPS